MDNNTEKYILIVDDNFKNLQVLGNFLKNNDHNVAVATHGKLALDMIADRRPDLILLDIMMPGMDGFETCRKIKENPKTKDIPVIFLTAKVESEDIVKGFALGAADYVTKPFNFPELQARISTHLKLSRTQRELQEANETKDKFFSIIGHDLKNPLNSICGFSDLLVSNYENFDENKIKKFMANINHSAMHMLDLLENLLQWARMQSDRMEWHPENINLTAISEETISLFEANTDKKKIKISSNIKDNTHVFADDNMVKTIFRNLISNAIKFTDENGNIKITSESKKDFEEVTISDNGVGMAESDMEKIFKPDVWHSTYGTANEKGTGLGLSLCRDFVEKNGGEIRMESEVDKGSSFIFTLPIEKGKRSQDTAPAALAALEVHE